MTTTEFTAMTAPKLPARVEPDSCEENPGYNLESTVSGVGSHFIDNDRGEWKVWPGHVDNPISVAEANDYVRELRIALSAAKTLNQHKPKEIAPSDVAIAAEVEALIADRDWTKDEAAEAFGMTHAKLTSRLAGRSGWTVTDLVALATGLGRDEDEVWELLASIGNAGFVANRQAREARELRRAVDVTDQFADFEN